MIYPSAADILRCIDQTLADACDPELPRMAVNSALATTRHMVRHVGLRLRGEAALLLDDIAATRALLECLAAHFAGHAQAPPALVGGVRDVLALPPFACRGAADELAQIAERALRQRELVYQALRALQGFTAETRAMPDHAAMRQHIRDYIAFELQQEATLVQPAFAGRGPRR